MSLEKICWNCKTSVNSSSFFCNKCGKIQEPFEINAFEIFDIKKEFLIDSCQLEEKYLKLQVKLHPDKFVNTTEEEKKFSNHHSSKVNESYKELTNNVSRAKILLKLNGYINDMDSKTFGDESMLEEIMELQNLCMLAETDESKKKANSDIQKVIKSTLDELNSSFKKKLWDDMYKFNIKLSYLEKMKKNLN